MKRRSEDEKIFMSKSKDDIHKKAVYLPNNEPYLGRELVFQFDQVILSCLEANGKVAAYTHTVELSVLQKAACQVIPQGINLALTIRELVRQGYLFGALVLMRPLIERAAIVSYLNKYPDKIEIWREGWQRNERPKLTDMLKVMSDKIDIGAAKQICELFGHIVHGDPVAQLCDFICFQAYCYLIVLMGMMVACFPDV